MKFNKAIDQQETQRGLWLQVALTVGPALVGALISLLFSLLAGFWTVVSAAILALLATPLAQLLELYSMRSKNMKAFINIPGESHE